MVAKFQTAAICSWLRVSMGHSHRICPKQSLASSFGTWGQKHKTLLKSALQFSLVILTDSLLAYIKIIVQVVCAVHLVGLGQSLATPLLLVSLWWSLMCRPVPLQEEGLYHLGGLCSVHPLLSPPSGLPEAEESCFVKILPHSSTLRF